MWQSILGWGALFCLAAIVAGGVVLLAPRALNYAVAAYLLLVGIIGVLPMLHGHGPSLRAAQRSTACG